MFIQQRAGDAAVTPATTTMLAKRFDMIFTPDYHAGHQVETLIAVSVLAYFVAGLMWLLAVAPRFRAWRARDMHLLKPRASSKAGSRQQQRNGRLRGFCAYVLVYLAWPIAFAVLICVTLRRAKAPWRREAHRAVWPEEGRAGAGPGATSGHRRLLSGESTPSLVPHDELTVPSRTASEEQAAAWARSSPSYHLR